MDAAKPIQPFKNIALCFSGGGFRAASFSLGVLSYLNHLKLQDKEGKSIALLDSVRFIASTSGGSITNLLYNYYIHKEGRTEDAFLQCFKKLYTSMKGTAILHRALEILNSDSEWRESSQKTRNLINAFAKVYDETFFGGSTFSHFWSKLPDGIALCINTTEFYRGLPFRFQTSGNPQSKEQVGNAFVNFRKKDTSTLGKIRLADIMASSSCFPSGFEPIMYPEDFTYSNGNEILTAAELRNALQIKAYSGAKASLSGSIGFMDGGITDNQALYSTMLADKRNKGDQAFDLIMVNDVTSYFMDPFIVPKEEKKAAWASKTLSGILKNIRTLLHYFSISSWGFIILFLLSLLGIIFFEKESWQNFSFFILGLSFFGLALVLYITGHRHGNGLISRIDSLKDESFLRNYLSEAFGKEKLFSQTVINSLAHTLEHTRFGSLHQMLASRLSSVVIMASDVNLKHVRRIIYELFYRSNQWENRRVSNFIYELSFQNMPALKSRLGKGGEDVSFKISLPESDRLLLLNISNELANVAEEARKMGTTLWFDEGQDQVLDKIIQCGQFTCCYNLLEYTLKLEQEIKNGNLNLDDWQKSQLAGLKTVLLYDWQQFNMNPAFLFDMEVKRLPAMV